MRVRAISRIEVVVNGVFLMTKVRRVEFFFCFAGFGGCMRVRAISPNQMVVNGLSLIRKFRRVEVWFFF